MVKAVVKIDRPNWSFSGTRFAFTVLVGFIVAIGVLIIALGWALVEATDPPDSPDSNVRSAPHVTMDRMLL
ncbi:hypothetical protein [Streptomyces luteireticuli]|uniref:Uncharacterized protein n=1 Tax=Streptomyces luteireticuli TaxID=173858 RepID=A0ABP3IIV8_9ACTN